MPDSAGFQVGDRVECQFLNRRFTYVDEKGNQQFDPAQPGGSGTIIAVEPLEPLGWPYRVSLDAGHWGRFAGRELELLKE